MNEFALASNRTLTLLLGDTVVEMRQVVMAEFDRFVQHAYPIRQALNELSKDKTFEQQIKVFATHSSETTQLVLLLSNLTIGQIEQVTTDTTGLIQLIDALYRLNSAFFDEIVKPQPKASKNDKSTWFDGFQFLISQGHKHSDIMQYSYGAYLGYIDAAGRSYRRHLRSLAAMTRTAQHADKNGMDKFMQDLARD